MSNMPQIMICFLLTVVAGCQPSNPQKAALQGTVYYGHAKSIEPKDTQYVIGTAYFARAEGVEFEEPSGASSFQNGRSESEREFFEWMGQRFAEWPKEWNVEGDMRFPVGVGPIQQTPIEDEGQFTFTDIEPGSYIVWFQWMYGEVRSGNRQWYQGPRKGISTPFRVNIEEGKVVRREFRLNPFLDIVTA